jgi:hypothetical protein
LIASQFEGLKAEKLPDHYGTARTV